MAVAIETFLRVTERRRSEAQGHKKRTGKQQ
jgi:hypothetical protein